MSDLGDDGLEARATAARAEWVEETALVQPVANGTRLKIVADGHETFGRVEDSRVEGHTLLLTVVPEGEEWKP